MFLRSNCPPSDLCEALVGKRQTAASWGSGNVNQEGVSTAPEQDQTVLQCQQGEGRSIPIGRVPREPGAQRGAAGGRRGCRGISTDAAKAHVLSLKPLAASSFTQHSWLGGGDWRGGKKSGSVNLLILLHSAGEPKLESTPCVMLKISFPNLGQLPSPPPPPQLPTASLGTEDAEAFLPAMKAAWESGSPRVTPARKWIQVTPYLPDPRRAVGGSHTGGEGLGPPSAHLTPSATMAQWTGHVQRYYVSEHQLLWGRLACNVIYLFITFINKCNTGFPKRLTTTQSRRNQYN